MSKAKKESEAVHAFVDGQFNDPKTCPKTIMKPRSNKAWCSKCGGECEGHYGFCGGYGCGSSMVCMKCCTVHDFVADND